MNGKLEFCVCVNANGELEFLCVNGDIEGFGGLCARARVCVCMCMRARARAIAHLFIQSCSNI